MDRSLESSQEEKTLKTEEDTSTETGESEENETETEEDTSKNETEEGEKTDDGEGEESVEALKARLQKAEQDRDNYKQGMLAAKGKKRGEEGLQTKVKTEVKADVNEDTVAKVLSKREEQKALRNTIDTKHSDYIPELVDDNQYQEIIGYMPRNIDKTSYDSIVRGLKLATKMWKEDKGIQDKSSKKDTGLQNSKSSTSSGSPKEKRELAGRFKNGNQDYLNWYKK